MQSYVPIYPFNKVYCILHVAFYLFSFFTESFSTRSGAASRPPSQPPLGVRPVGQEQPGPLLMNTAEYVLEPLCVTLTHCTHYDQLSSAIKRAQSLPSTYSANSEKNLDRGHKLKITKIIIIYINIVSKSVHPDQLFL